MDCSWIADGRKAVGATMNQLRRRGSRYIATNVTVDGDFDRIRERVVESATRSLVPRIEYGVRIRHVGHSFSRSDTPSRSFLGPPPPLVGRNRDEEEVSACTGRRQRRPALNSGAATLLGLWQGSQGSSGEENGSRGWRRGGLGTVFASPAHRSLTGCRSLRYRQTRSTIVGTMEDQWRINGATRRHQDP